MSDKTSKHNSAIRLKSGAVLSAESLGNYGFLRDSTGFEATFDSTVNAARSLEERAKVPDKLGNIGVRVVEALPALERTEKSDAIPLLSAIAFLALEQEGFFPPYEDYAALEDDLHEVEFGPLQQLTLADGPFSMAITELADGQPLPVRSEEAVISCGPTNLLFLYGHTYTSKIYPSFRPAGNRTLVESFIDPFPIPEIPS